MQPNRTCRTDRARGFTLIEVALVLAIAGVAVVALFSIYQRASADADASDLATALTEMQHRVSDYYHYQTNYSTLTNAVAVSKNLVPLILNRGGSIQTPDNTAITLGPAAPNTTWKMVFSVASSQCASLAADLSGQFLSVVIQPAGGGSYTVDTPATGFLPATVGSACGSTGPYTFTATSS